MKAILNAILDFIKAEPVVIAQLIPLIVAAAAVFGLKWSPEGVAAIVTLAEAIAVILARQNVTPVASLPTAPPPLPPAPAA